MIFRRSCLLLALALTATTNAWVSPSLPTSATTRLSTHLYSTMEKVEVGAPVTLSDDYKAAQAMAMEKVAAALSDKQKEAGMVEFISHFVGEYLGTAQRGMAQAETDEEKAIYSPQAAAGRILQVIQNGQRFGMPNSPDFYSFDVSHEALRGNPETENGNEVDYYQLGCDFFRPCMDLKNSKVMGQENLDKAMAQLAAGDNVVFLANHPSEADPQVMSCMLEKAGYKEEAADMTFVAGHKVTTDPLAIPFSMGRNLICIHSKKYINGDPETKGLKQRQNLKAMNAMLKKLKKGGTLLWVAPSGGRDRRNVETNQVPPAKFDSKTIDMFRLMGNKSKKPTHYYPLAIMSYFLCPPPDYTEAGVGEERNVRFVPVGISVGEETASVGGLESRKEFCSQAYQTCIDAHDELSRALGFGSSKVAQEDAPDSIEE